MGKKDLWQSDYFDDKKRFADMINGAYFKGEQVINADELEEVDSKLVHYEKNEEAVSYIKQQKRMFKKWKEVGYKFTNNEFLSQMRKEEKFTPVITLILYLGTDQIWDGAKSLYEMLEIKEEWEPFVTNHKLNLSDYHQYEDFSFFKTENRIIFELLSCAKDEIEMEKIIKENQYILDKETAKAILGMLGIKINLNKIMVRTEKGEGFDMCKAWDDHIERGRREEQKEGLNSLVNILATLLPDLDTIYNKIVSDKKYRNVTREQVEKYYYAK